MSESEWDPRIRAASERLRRARYGLMAALDRGAAEEELRRCYSKVVFWKGNLDALIARRAECHADDGMLS